MAEIELSVLSRQCLSRRLSSLEEATRKPRGMAEPSQPGSSEGQLALHDGRCANQAQASLPVTRCLTEN